MQEIELTEREPRERVLSPRALSRVEEERKFIASLQPLADQLEIKARKAAECVSQLRELIDLSERTIVQLEGNLRTTGIAISRNIAELGL